VAQGTPDLSAQSCTSIRRPREFHSSSSNGLELARPKTSNRVGRGPALTSVNSVRVDREGVAPGSSACVSCRPRLREVQPALLPVPARFMSDASHARASDMARHSAPGAPKTTTRGAHERIEPALHIAAEPELDPDGRESARSRGRPPTHARARVDLRAGLVDLGAGSDNIDGALTRVSPRSACS